MWHDAGAFSGKKIIFLFWLTDACHKTVLEKNASVATEAEA